MANHQSRPSWPGVERRPAWGLGVHVTPIAKDALPEAVHCLSRTGNLSVVLGHNLHSVYLYHTNLALKQTYDSASIVLADGKPVQVAVQIGSGLKGLKADPVPRLGSTDWLLDAIISHSYSRVAVIGATKQSNSAFISIMRKMALKTEFQGLDGERWNEARSDEALRFLSDFQPDLTVVALGMPLQEEFIANNLASLPKSVYVLVGGAIDQISGYQLNAPRWLGNLGVEWVWRLASQPRRLAHRYLVEPWHLAGILIAKKLAFLCKKKT